MFTEYLSTKLFETVDIHNLPNANIFSYVLTRKGKHNMATSHMQTIIFNLIA